uniref:Melanocyte-stimulating hormone receptor n=1 Tax=Ciona intestinalis TaxID=7719 RepID=F6PRI1_CIOIN|nr:melanocyte-stimulating hormone receptor [Ciona intestinalis]|eukprot:XP_002120969.1 melanocyte-stimulating hormone receptor [Ciona intestinalis]
MNTTAILPGAANSTQTVFNRLEACLLTVSCEHDDLSISAVIVAFAVLALLENCALAAAILTWKLGHACKMFWFLWHLSVADGMLAVTFVFFHTMVILSCPNHFSCQSNSSVQSTVVFVMFFANILSSHLFVLAATLDRFIAIKHPLRYSELMTSRRVRIVSLIIWVVSFLIPIGGGLGLNFGNSSIAYSVTTLTAAVISLTAAVVVIALNIWMVKFAISIIMSMQTPPPSTQHQPSRPSIVPNIGIINESLKPATTLALFVVSFIVSCAPWSVALIVCEEVKKCTIKQHQDYTLVLVLFHAIVIPFIYGFRVEEIRHRVIIFWKRVFDRAPHPAGVYR